MGNLTAKGQGGVQFVYDEKLAAKGQRNGGVLTARSGTSAAAETSSLDGAASSVGFVLPRRPWSGI
ncbi:hypothetical protein PsorP6_018228 [Peronosclerospora sorghi]|uniref:Uncharacterized protein n=1 Tax=Peronosclerospora sorghi TaxID=230839 RepID=A0ACC0WCS0_9STRA|nr:hypothetical protein PsorP6_018228 [Peronosclerospora sorghi]